MITSAANEHIKALRKLDQAKDRRASGNFLAEGLKVVGQAFDSDAHIHELLIAPELLISEYGRSLTELARKRDIPILELSPSVFAMLARKEKPQGIAALIAKIGQISAHHVLNLAHFGLPLNRFRTRAIWALSCARAMQSVPAA